MTREEENRGKKTEPTSRLLRFFSSIKRMVGRDRPPEIDREIEKIRRQREEARQLMERAKATLNGEDSWFRTEKEKNDDHETGD